MNSFFSTYTIFFALLIQLIGLTFATIVDPYIKKKHRIIIIINCILTSILIAQNYLDYSFSLEKSKYFYRIITGILGYSLRPVILVMWIYLIRRHQSLIIAWSLIIVNTMIHLTAFFSNVCFTITSDNIFSRGPLGYSCHVISGVLLLYLFWLSTDAYIESVNFGIDKNERTSIPDVSNDVSSINMKQELKKYGYGLEALIPTFCVLVIIVSVVLDSEIYLADEPLDFLTMAIVSCNLFYYLWLHLGFVRAYEEEMKTKEQ